MPAVFATAPIVGMSYMVCIVHQQTHDMYHALLTLFFVVAGVTAGYGDEVIFADGTFIDGSTAELSADGPIRPPYVVYCQGGTHWTHWALALESALASLQKHGVVPPAAAAAAVPAEVAALN